MAGNYSVVGWGVVFRRNRRLYINRTWADRDDAIKALKDLLKPYAYPGEWWNILTVKSCLARSSRRGRRGPKGQVTRRDVCWRGKVLTQVEFHSGADREAFARAGAEAVEHAFVRFPVPLPPQPRMRAVAKAIRIAMVPGGPDDALEQQIVAAFVEEHGAEFVERMFDRAESAA